MASPYGWDRFQTEWSDERIREFVRAAPTDRAQRVMADVRIAANMLAQAEATFDDSFPDRAQQAIQQGIEQVTRYLDQYKQQAMNRDVSADQMDRSLDQLAAEIRTGRDQITMNTRPYITSPFETVAELTVAASKLLEDAGAAQATHRQMLEQLQRTAAESAAGELAAFYKTEGARHAKISTRFFWGIGAFSLVLAATAILTFLVAPPHLQVSASGTEQVVEFARAALGRIAVLSLVTFAISFCARNYRVNKHLETLNRTRYNALMTAQRFIESAEPDTRTIIVSELVKAIFGSGDSGYIDSANDSMVIESPAGLVTALLASKATG